MRIFNLPEANPNNGGKLTAPEPPKKDEELEAIKMAFRIMSGGQPTSDNTDN